MPDPYVRNASLTIELTIRDLTLDDLADAGWSGSPEHLASLAAQTAAVGTRVLTITAAGRPIAIGVASQQRQPGVGWVSSLSVHEQWQSLGVGTILIGALEDVLREQGLATVGLSVELDNPDAARLYRRLGYAATGSTLDGWSIGPGRSYVTLCRVMTKSLRPSDGQ